MKRLPIGEQHFRKIIDGDLLYVDKTEAIYRLITTGSYYFLSRPRRFGKSLLVSTLKELFQGNRELFKGLWIEDKIEWVEHPVIHLDFSLTAFRQLGLEEALILELDNIAQNYQLELTKTTAKTKFKELIELLSKKNNIVVLIDEYDKPIIHYLTNFDKADENREILKDFFGVLKGVSDKLHFLFITGITKFSKVSLFSDLNNLFDITLNKQFTTLVGITTDELQYYFTPYLQKLADEMGKSLATVLKNLKRIYNGYSWDGKHFVYNPFSLLLFCEEGRFRNFWFATGTPTFLVEVLRKQRVSLEKLDRMRVRDLFFQKFDLHNLDIYALLFQTGYSTIKKITLRHFTETFYLGFPNNEVRQAFIHNLIEAYTFKPNSTVSDAIHYIEDALYDKDMPTLKRQLNILFADISYHLFPPTKKQKDELRERQEFKAWEGYFHTVMYLVLQFLGFHIDIEVSKHRGRLDAIVTTDDYLYIMEFKLDDAQAALAQIKEQGYAESYKNTDKQLILVGIAFDQAKRVVKNLEVEVV